MNIKTFTKFSRLGLRDLIWFILLIIIGSGIVLYKGSNLISIISEIRNWLLVIIGTTGLVVTMKTYLNTLDQKSIDNTYKTLDFIREHVTEEEINIVVLLFHANNELRGIPYDTFIFDEQFYKNYLGEDWELTEDFEASEATVSDMFAEGFNGGTQIFNIIELFNLISPTLDLLHKEIVWYEYGQILNIIYKWTRALGSVDKEHLFEHETNYIKYNRWMDNLTKDMENKPMKFYTSAE